MVHVCLCGSAAAISSAYACACGSAAAFVLDSRLSLWFCRAFCFDSRLPLRFCCGVRPRFTPAVYRMATNRTACGSVARFAFVHARACGSVAAPPSRAPGIAFLSQLRPRFAPGLCIPVAALPSARGWPCGSVAALFLGSRRGWRFCCGVLPSVHSCLFSFVRKKETACGILRFYSAGSRSPFVRSRNVGAVICLGGFTSGLAVYFWRSRRVTGERRNEERGWRRGACASLRNRIGIVSFSAGSTLGLRAPDCAKESSTLWTLLTLRRDCVGAWLRRLCVFARPHWLCCAFRWEYVGGCCAPPNLRQRVECGSGTAASLDSPQGLAE